MQTNPFLLFDENKVKNKILDLAKTDDRIRGVILNGSRANSKIIPDEFQDFDVVFIVNDFDDLVENKKWFVKLGKIYLQQLPDEMEIGKGENNTKISYTFLTIFDDGSRIDLTLFPKEKFFDNFVFDSLSIIWLDKDNLFENISESSDIDYHVIKPTQREFSEVCNEFWWCVTNIAKGLKRNEIIYAKAMLENVVRPMFLKMIEWRIGFENNFSVSIGKSGKFLEQYLDKPFYNLILQTYSDSVIDNNWKSLFLLMDIFQDEQGKCAKNLELKYNSMEAENAKNYVKKMENS